MATPDATKWTDVLVAYSTAAQTVFVLLGVVVAVGIAVWQIRQARFANAAVETDKIFDMLHGNGIPEAITRISTSLNPEDDRERIAQILALSESHSRRLQCEGDIFLLTYWFERVWDKYKNGLISRERYLEMYDEITLYVWHSISNAYLQFDQPDYEPMRRLAARCWNNYALWSGNKNENLIRLRVATNSSSRYRLHELP